MDLFSASPFGEPYPISREEILSSQPSIPWTANLDYVLCGFVRKYEFDFRRASLAMRRYIDSILCELDNEHWDANAFTEETCRLRWSYLDFEEYQRRQKIAKELCSLRVLFLDQSKQSGSVAGAGHCDREIFSERQVDDSKTSPSIDARAEELTTRWTKSSWTEDVQSMDRDATEALAEVHSTEIETTSSHSKPKAVKTTSAIPDLEQYDEDTEQSKTSPETKERTLSELEKTVLNEGLEVSDFTIFSHDLKTQFEGFYNEVRNALPSMQDSEVACSDEDDEDVEPVFSNLRVDEKTGEYVGNIVRLGPPEKIEPKGPSSTVTAVSKVPSLSQSSISNVSGASLDEHREVVEFQQTSKPQTNSDDKSGWSDGEDALMSADAQELTAVSGNGSCAALDWRQARSEGRESAQRGDHARAVEQITEAIAALEAGGDTGSTALGLMWQERAESLMAIHHFAEAADDWRRRLRHMASEARGEDSAAATRARLQLAISLRFTGQYLDAAQEVEKVLKVEPENQLARCARHTLICAVFILISMMRKIVIESRGEDLNSRCRCGWGDSIE
jgi:tetratricopeptide (TPR) repeat protein